MGKVIYHIRVAIAEFLRNLAFKIDPIFFNDPPSGMDSNGMYTDDGLEDILHYAAEEGDLLLVHEQLQSLLRCKQITMSQYEKWLPKPQYLVDELEGRLEDLEKARQDLEELMEEKRKEVLIEQLSGVKSG